jgi:polyhydroxyalkanoate synthesis regulator phasin
MSPPPFYNLKAMFADLAQFQQMMDDVHAGLSNPEDKARLGELLGQLQKARAEAEEKVPGIVQEKLDDVKAQLAEMQELQKEIDQKQAELEAKNKADAEAEKEEEVAVKEEETQAPEAAAAKPGMKVPALPPLPSLPEVPIDPALGQDLRLEVLKTYGGLITRGR